MCFYIILLVVLQIHAKNMKPYVQFNFQIPKIGKLLILSLYLCLLCTNCVLLCTLQYNNTWNEIIKLCSDSKKKLTPTVNQINIIILWNGLSYYFLLILYVWCAHKSRKITLSFHFVFLCVVFAFVWIKKT